MEINDLLLELARTRAQIEPVVAQLKERKNEATAALKAAESELEKAEDETRAAILRYVQETGDLTPHPLVTFRRTTKMMYDRNEITESILRETVMPLYAELHDDEIVDLLLSGKLGKYLRVKVELDVRQFEEDYKAGELNWCQVETVPAPQIAIGKLGSLLIETGGT